MGLRFASQLQVDNLPDEQTDNQFEVFMPEIDLNEAIKKKANKSSGFLSSVWSAISGSNYRPIVEEIIFGPKKFTTDTRRVRTGWYNVPKDIDNYTDVQITMFCPNTMQTQYYLEAWRNQMFNEDGEYYYDGKDYKKNIEVFIYGPGGSGLTSTFIPSLHYTLKGCFPWTQGDYKLQYTNEPKRLRLTATFKVDKVVLDKDAGRNMLLTSVISSPTSILDNLITSATNGTTSKYTMENTYGSESSTKYSLNNLK